MFAARYLQRSGWAIPSALAAAGLIALVVTLAGHGRWAGAAVITLRDDGDADFGALKGLGFTYSNNAIGSTQTFVLSDVTKVISGGVPDIKLIHNGTGEPGTPVGSVLSVVEKFDGNGFIGGWVKVQRNAGSTGIVFDIEFPASDGSSTLPAPTPAATVTPAAISSTGRVYVANEWSRVTSEFPAASGYVHAGGGNPVYGTYSDAGRAVQPLSDRVKVVVTDTDLNTVVTHWDDGDTNSASLNGFGFTFPASATIGASMVFPLSSSDAPIAGALGDVVLVDRAGVRSLGPNNFPDTFDDIYIPVSPSVLEVVGKFDGDPASGIPAWIQVRRNSGTASVAFDVRHPSSLVNFTPTLGTSFSTGAVRVKSDVNPVGVGLLLRETGISTSRFEGYINFVSIAPGNTDASSVAPGDTTARIRVNSGPVIIEYNDFGVFRSATVIVDTVPPVPVIDNPVHESVTGLREPAFTGTVFDTGSGLKLAQQMSGPVPAGPPGQFRLFIDRTDDPLDATAVLDGAGNPSGSNSPEPYAPAAPGDGAGEIAFFFEAPTLPNASIAFPDHLVDFQVSASDLAGNIGFSDSNPALESGGVFGTQNAHVVRVKAGAPVPTPVPTPTPGLSASPTPEPTPTATQVPATGPLNVSNEWSKLTTEFPPRPGYIYAGTGGVYATYPQPQRLTAIQSNRLKISLADPSLNTLKTIWDDGDANQATLAGAGFMFSASTPIGGTQVFVLSDESAPIVGQTGSIVLADRSSARNAGPDGLPGTNDDVFVTIGPERLQVITKFDGDGVVPGWVQLQRNSGSTAVNFDIRYQTSGLDQTARLGPGGALVDGAVRVKTDANALGVGVLLLETGRSTSRFEGFVELADNVAGNDASSIVAGDVQAKIRTRLGPVHIEYNDGGTFRTIQVEVDVVPPVVEFNAPAHNSATQNRFPQFTGAVTDDGSGLKLVQQVIGTTFIGPPKSFELFFDRRDDPSNASPVLVSSGQPDFLVAAEFVALGSIQDGQKSLAFSHTPLFALPNASIIVPDHRVDFQVRVNDLAGNIGFSDSDPSS
jgi:hypothetical protein